MELFEKSKEEFGSVWADGVEYELTVLAEGCCGNQKKHGQYIPAALKWKHRSPQNLSGSMISASRGRIRSL